MLFLGRESLRESIWFPIRAASPARFGSDSKNQSRRGAPGWSAARTVRPHPLQVSSALGPEMRLLITTWQLIFMWVLSFTMKVLLSFCLN